MSLHPDLTDDPFEKLDAQQDDFLARLEKQAVRALVSRNFQVES